MSGPPPLRLSDELALLIDATGRATGVAAAASPPPTATRADLDWRRFGRLAAEHELGRLLGDRPHILAPYAPPEALMGRLTAQRIQGTHDAAARTWHLQRVLDLTGPGAIVLKGGAVAEELYDDVGRRHMSDLDLLLDDRPAALAASHKLCDAGFVPVRARSPRHLPALTDHVAEITVELHTELATPALGPELLDALRASATPTTVLGRPARVLAPAGRLLHHAIHAIDGPVATPLLRNLLEVALMARRLDPDGQAELAALTADPAVRERVARGTWLAASLFESPTLLPAPQRSVLGLIARRRLEWVAAEPGAWPRFREHVAAKAAEQAYGAGRFWGARQALKALVEGCRDAIDNRRDHQELEGARLVRRPELVATPFGDARILHDPETGEVHVLGALAVRAWELSDGQLTAAELTRELVATGTSPEEARGVVEGLVEADVARTLRHHDRARRLFVTRPGRRASA